MLWFERGGLAFDGAADEVAMSHAAYFFYQPSFPAGVGQADAASRTRSKCGFAPYRSAISGVMKRSPSVLGDRVGPGCCAVRVGAAESWRRGPTRPVLDARGG